MTEMKLPRWIAKRNGNDSNWKRKINFLFLYMFCFWVIKNNEDTDAIIRIEIIKNWSLNIEKRSPKKVVISKYKGGKE